MENKKNYKFIENVSYLECGEGWHKIIYNVLGYIDLLLNTRTDHNIKKIVIKQIKEKFGALRIYYDLEQDDSKKENINLDLIIDSVINYSEYLSTETCETCGAPGNLKRKNGWFSTSCELHENFLN